MSDLIKLYIESTDGEKFECEIPPATKISVLAADFFDNRNWPTSDSRGKEARAVVELVDPENSSHTKRLRGDATISEAGLWDGALLRIFPESIAGGQTFDQKHQMVEQQVNVAGNYYMQSNFESSLVSALRAVLPTVDFRPVLHPIFRETNFEVEDDLCFVLMPFKPTDLQVIYQDHVKPTLENHKLRVQRSDDIYTTGAIIDDIWSGINRAKVIIADLTGRNPNVFYEIGICHTLGKQVVLLTQSIEDVPFDLRHLRVIVYEYTPRGMKYLEQQLAKVVRSVLGLEKAQQVTNVSILFLAADPTDASRLRLGEELREIQEKLQLAKMRENFFLHQRMSVRPADISQALLDISPNVVHFSGHGTNMGALCFENKVGETHPIQSDALAALFEQFATQVDCILLNACYSETQAKALAKHINYVIGMNRAIGDEAAIAFAIGFYQALGAGRTIEEAYKLGCVQIRLQGIPEHLTPVLIKKG